jgi:hypothetical protein
MYVFASLIINVSPPRPFRDSPMHHTPVANSPALERGWISRLYCNRLAAPEGIRTGCWELHTCQLVRCLAAVCVTELMPSRIPPVSPCVYTHVSRWTRHGLFPRRWPPKFSIWLTGHRETQCKYSVLYDEPNRERPRMYHYSEFLLLPVCTVTTSTCVYLGKVTSLGC